MQLYIHKKNKDRETEECDIAHFPLPCGQVRCRLHMKIKYELDLHSRNDVGWSLAEETFPKNMKTR